VLLTMAALPAEFAVRRIGPADAGALIALAAMDNLFDEDPGIAPSGELTPDGAREFLADPSVLFWLAESGDRPWDSSTAASSGAGRPAPGPSCC
jgi:hypothetical protein